MFHSICFKGVQATCRGEASQRRRMNRVLAWWDVGFVPHLANLFGIAPVIRTVGRSPTQRFQWHVGTASKRLLSDKKQAEIHDVKRAISSTMKFAGPAILNLDPDYGWSCARQQKVMPRS